MPLVEFTVEAILAVRPEDQVSLERSHQLFPAHNNIFDGQPTATDYQMDSSSL
jgi:hypothetical protein